MVKIRKANFFDKFKFQKVISFMGTDAITHYTKVFMCPPFNFIHDLLPMKFKFMPESYVIEDNREILGMITVSPTTGNPLRLGISRLYLESDYFNVGKQLIDFVISKYGAKGANSFVAAVDDSHDELLHLFADGCGFRQCASEQLWKMEEIRFTKENSTFFRPFKNSDAQAVAMLFNDSVIPHFKYSIQRTQNEYKEPLFGGLEDYKFRYVVEDCNLNTIQAYFSLTTGDNFNYILDVTTSQWYDCSWEDILNFAISQISKRKKEFFLFVKVKKYTATSENFERFLCEKGFKCVQNQIVLVKDFYKIIKEPQSAHKIVLFNEISEKPVFKVFNDI